MVLGCWLVGGIGACIKGGGPIVLLARLGVRLLLVKV